MSSHTYPLLLFYILSEMWAAWRHKIKINVNPVIFKWKNIFWEQREYIQWHFLNCKKKKKNHTIKPLYISLRKFKKNSVDSHYIPTYIPASLLTHSFDRAILHSIQDLIHSISQGNCSKNFSLLSFALSFVFSIRVFPSSWNILFFFYNMLTKTFLHPTTYQGVFSTLSLLQWHAYQELSIIATHSISIVSFGSPRQAFFSTTVTEIALKMPPPISWKMKPWFAITLYYNFNR